MDITPKTAGAKSRRQLQQHQSAPLSRAGPRRLRRTRSSGAGSAANLKTFSCKCIIFSFFRFNAKFKHRAILKFCISQSCSSFDRRWTGCGAFQPRKDVWNGPSKLNIDKIFTFFFFLLLLLNPGPDEIISMVLQHLGEIDPHALLISVRCAHGQPEAQYSIAQCVYILRRILLESIIFMRTEKQPHS